MVCGWCGEPDDDAVMVDDTVFLPDWGPIVVLLLIILIRGPGVETAKSEKASVRVGEARLTEPSLFKLKVAVADVGIAGE